MKRFTMLIQRELWEHRSLWMTPAIIGVIMVLIVTIVGHVSWSGAPSHDDGPGVSLPGLPQQQSVWNGLLIGLSVPFFFASSILTAVYLLDCLYTERRDRSILFWRSLPVSDRETVLAKLTTGLLVTPLISWVALSVCGLLSAVVLKLRMGGLPVVGGYFDLQPLQAVRAEIVLLVALVLSALWYVPYAGYLLVISSWAKRSIFAWAVVPPVLISLVEKLVFGTAYFWHAVLGGFSEAAMYMVRIGRHLDHNLSHWLATWQQTDPAVPRQFAEPLGWVSFSDGVHLWVGLLIGAALVWLAIWMRQRSEEA